MPHARQELGREGEKVAERFLRRQRYAILQKNYRCLFGEVDIIALDGPAVVFVEVRTRTGGDFGTPFESVDRRKQGQIIKSALHFLSQHRLHGREARFDVVGVWWEGTKARCEHVKNAFELPT